MLSCLIFKNLAESDRRTWFPYRPDQSFKFLPRHQSVPMDFVFRSESLCNYIFTITFHFLISFQLFTFSLSLKYVQVGLTESLLQALNIQIASGSYFFKGISCLLLDSLVVFSLLRPQVFLFDLFSKSFKMPMERVAQRSQISEGDESSNITPNLPRFDT